MPNLTRSLALPAILLLAGCQTPAGETGMAAASVAAPQDARCGSAAAWIDTGFDTGALASCSFAAPAHVVMAIEPEDEPPINCSAWYAFRVTPRREEQLSVDLTYEACGHRYWPKISFDGESWQNLPQEAVTVTEIDGVRQANVTLPAATQPYFVAGQEIVDPGDYDEWLDALAASPAATRWQLGSSAQGRAIPGMTIVAPGAEPVEQVVLIGRQHPPEVTGFVALKPFVETILGDTPLAEAFRARFEVTLVPMLNPDGVALGHWRHATGGLDLNRDWGPFTQPETQLMDAYLTAMEADPARKLRLFLDFHSTQRDIFYTIPDAEPTDPPLFIAQWLGRLHERMPEYAINRDSNHNPDAATSKGYVYRTYGVPTTTFEIGDETDRALIERLGREAASAMMEVLLETPEP